MQNLEENLKEIEEYFGGLQTKVPRRIVSPKDPRSILEIKKGGMTGGDRMTQHGYAKHYAKHLLQFVEKKSKPYTILECGILRGTGLAMWSTLFPNSTIIGLDVDLSHTKDNLDFLKFKGAFKNNKLELYQFDQFEDNELYIKEILKDRKIDIAIDDGFHSDFTILNTLKYLHTHLNDEFCYFIEDNRSVYQFLKKYTIHKTFSYEQLSVITS